MATISQVKAGLDAVAQRIAQNRARAVSAKAQFTLAQNELAAIPADYADLVATIDAYTPTGAFETLAKDEKAKLVAEFTALKSVVDSAVTDLATRNFG